MDSHDHRRLPGHPGRRVLLPDRAPAAPPHGGAPGADREPRRRRRDRSPPAGSTARSARSTTTTLELEIAPGCRGDASPAGAIARPTVGDAAERPTTARPADAVTVDARMQRLSSSARSLVVVLGARCRHRRARATSRCSASTSRAGSRSCSRRSARRSRASLDVAVDIIREPGRQPRGRRAGDQPPGRQHRRRPPGREGPRQGPRASSARPPSCGSGRCSPSCRPRARASTTTTGTSTTTAPGATTAATGADDHDHDAQPDRRGDHGRGRVVRPERSCIALVQAGATIPTTEPRRRQAQGRASCCRRGPATAKPPRCYLGPTALTGKGVDDGEVALRSRARATRSTMTLTDDGSAEVQPARGRSRSRKPPPQNAGRDRRSTASCSRAPRSRPRRSRRRRRRSSRAASRQDEAEDLATLINYGALPVQLEELATVRTCRRRSARTSSTPASPPASIGLAARRRSTCSSTTGCSARRDRRAPAHRRGSSTRSISYPRAGDRPHAHARRRHRPHRVGRRHRRLLRRVLRAAEGRGAHRAHRARRRSTAGFTRSFRTILAADLVSLIGAAVLYFLAIGSVRGFAFFLGIVDAARPRSSPTSSCTRSCRSWRGARRSCACAASASPSGLDAPEVDGMSAPAVAERRDAACVGTLRRPLPRAHATSTSSTARGAGRCISGTADRDLGGRPRPGRA